MKINKIWTEQEIQWLTENYAILSRKEIAEKLGRTIPSISFKAQTLFIKSSKAVKPWTTEEEEWLRNNYSILKPKKSAEVLGRTRIAVLGKATQLKIKAEYAAKNPACKVCCKCKIEKPFELFSKSSKRKNGVGSECFECRKAYLKNYRSLNKETLDIKQKEYYELTKERDENKRKAYYQENKERIKARVKLYAGNNKEKYNQYMNERRKNDINFRLRNSLSGRIRVALKRAMARKTNKSLELVGCSTQELNTYLTSLFEPQMTWQNYGLLWEMDHCIPLNLFDLTDPEQQKQAFHFTNIFPRWTTTEIAERNGSDQIGNSNKQDLLVDCCHYHLLQNPS